MAAAFRFDLPMPDTASLKTLSLWATYYYVPRVNHQPSGHPMLSIAGAALGPSLSLRDWCEAAMQGTVVVRRLLDGEPRDVVYNYAGVSKEDNVDCSPIYPRYPAINRTRFIAASAPFGHGVRGMALVPYRSVAVDPKTIAFGSVLYIPAARGTVVTLPDGRRVSHDGYFFAADRGGAIKRKHIDVFIGTSKRNPFRFVKNRKSGSFAAFVVAQDEAFSRLAKAHRHR